jgi:DNA-binding MarR family transcriptional regulator
VTTRYPGGPADSPGFLLWHATLAWQRAVTAVLRPLDLTHVQFVLLACTWWLDERGDVPNQMTLAGQAGTDVKMTSEVLRTLEAKGLVHRQVDPDDNRAKQLRITPAGVKLARRAIVAVERVDAEVFGAAASDLTRVLQRFVDPASFGGSPRSR